MITYDCTMTMDGGKKTGDFAFKGLSSDVKPTEAKDGIEIRNGSSFLEMDTKDLKFYDVAGKAWV